MPVLEAHVDMLLLGYLLEEFYPCGAWSLISGGVATSTSCLSGCLDFPHLAKSRVSSTEVMEII